jgi:hypothetical protein
MVFSVGSEDARALEINMYDLVGSLLRIGEEEDAQTAAETAGNWNLVAAHQRRILPAHLAGRLCREISVEVGGGSEECHRYVLLANAVCSDHFAEEFAAGYENVLRSIAIYGDSAPDTSAEQCSYQLSITPAVPV